MRRWSLFALMVLGGCHGRWVKAAPGIDTAELRVNVNGDAQVELGTVDDGGLVGAIINVAQAVKSADQTQRLRNAIQKKDMKAGFYRGLSSGLGEGPPASIADSGDTDALIVLNVRRYGMYVQNLGDPGTLDVIAKLKIYNKASERIYGKRLRCRTTFGDPALASVLFSTVNNVKQLKQMSDAEVNQTFVGIAEYCGDRFAMKMRQHARE